MSKSCKYIENILLEIIDQPWFWLKNDHSNKFNIGAFDSQNAALAFLQEYNQRNFFIAQKIILNYNNKRLHLIVRDLKYGNIDKNSEEICNTTVEFIYYRILFSQIKWPKVSISNKKESELMNIIQDSQHSNYQSINNFQQVIDQSLTLGHTNDEKTTRFQTTIIIHLNQNDDD